MNKNNMEFKSGYISEDGAYGYSDGTFEYKVRRMTQNRRAKKGENQGKVKIEVEVDGYKYTGKGSYDRNRFYLDTNIWVDPKNWSNKTQKLHLREKDSEYKNNVINNTYAKATSYIASKGQQDIDFPYVENVNFSKMREIFPSRKENRKTFFDLMVDYKSIRSSDGDTRERTVLRIGTVANTVKAYDDHNNRKTYIEDINFNWSDNFNAWMVHTKKFRPATINRTYEIICGCMEHYWKRRDEMKLQMSDKFKDPEFKKGKKESNAPHALSVEQRDILFNHKIDKPYLEKARKMMCIQAYSGCRYSDIKTFTPDNFKRDGFLVFTPIKTSRYKTEVRQPLHPNLKQLFEEVDYNTTNIYTTTSQKYNSYIKEVLQVLMDKFPEAGFSDDYTTHNMRDTAISIWVRSGVNFKSILKWAGLTKYQTLDHYIDTDDSFEVQEMNKTILGIN